MVKTVAISLAIQSLGRRRGWAASRSPARAISSGGEGRGARPRAADEQLVGGGQRLRVLPGRKEGSIRCRASCGPEGGLNRGAPQIGGLECRLGAGHGEERT